MLCRQLSLSNPERSQTVISSWVLLGPVVLAVCLESATAAGRTSGGPAVGQAAFSSATLYPDAEHMRDRHSSPPHRLPLPRIRFRSALDARAKNDASDSTGIARIPGHRNSSGANMQCASNRRWSPVPKPRAWAGEEDLCFVQLSLRGGACMRAWRARRAGDARRAVAFPL